MEKAKVRRTTRDYLNEIVSLHEEVCRLEKNDYLGLSKLKEKYLEFTERSVLYHILGDGLEEKDKAFLSDRKIKTFSRDHKKLQGVIWYHLMYGIIPGLMAGEINRRYLIKTVQLARLEFARTYGEVQDYAYSLTKGKVRHRLRKHTPGEIDVLRRKLRKGMKELPRGLPKEKALSRKETQHIGSEIIPYLDSYNRFVEEHFFRIRDLFKWYKKEIRVYTGDIGLAGKFFILVYVYQSDSNRLHVFPKKLALFSSIEFNVEELGKTTEMARMIMLSKTSWESQRFRNVLSIGDETPLQELLVLLWSAVSKKERVLFLVRVFQLLGFGLSEHGQFENVFKLTRTNVTLDESASARPGKEGPSLFILTDKSYLSQADVKGLIEFVKSKKLVGKSRDVIYTIMDTDTGSEHELARNGIHNLSLTHISRLLMRHNLYLFLAPFVERVITEMDKKSLNSEMERRSSGSRLKEKLVNLDSWCKSFKLFEDLMVEVFEFLFRDSFRTYYAEPQASEYDRHRRRDLVVSNVNPVVDFWKSRKSEQNAKRIIVDFKNYSTQISQNTVNDVAKYLSPKRGNFGIIITRKGLSKSGFTEQKIKYFDNDQLIITLDTNDLTEMINYKINNQVVEDILERKVAELSM